MLAQLLAEMSEFGASWRKIDAITCGKCRNLAQVGAITCGNVGIWRKFGASKSATYNRPYLSTVKSNNSVNPVEIIKSSISFLVIVLFLLNRFLNLLYWENFLQ